MKILGDLAKLGTSVTADVSRAAQTASGDLTHDAFAAGQAAASAVHDVTGSPPSTDLANDGLLVGAGGETFPPSTPLSAVPAVLPEGGVRNGETIVFVNGMGANVSDEETSMQYTANATGSRVVGVHDATNGFVPDGLQAVGDMLDVGGDKAVTTLAQTIQSELAAGRPIHIMAHSKGAAETSRAIEEVSQNLSAQGLSPAQVQAELHQVKVETFGGADAHYPDGPEYVHYVNEDDVVPMVFGLGGPADPRQAFAGSNAVVEEFRDPGAGGLLGPHDFNSVYLSHWKPFDEVYPQT
jgi:hypothetical protein